MSRLGAALVLLLGLVVLPAAGAAQGRRVAVLDFANSTRNPDVEWLGPAASETIVSKLAGVRALHLVERAQLAKIIAEQRLQLSDLMDPTRMVKLGKLLGAEQVVIGAYATFGGTVRYTVRFVETETGSVVSTAQVNTTIDPQNPQAFWSGLDQLAEATIASLNQRVVVVDGQPRAVEVEAPRRIALSTDERERVRKAPTVSLTALEAYGKGATAFGKGDARLAVDHLREATRLDPNYLAAWTTLAEALYLRADGAGTRAAAQRALQLLGPDASPAQRSDVEFSLAGAAALQGDASVATHLRRSLELAEQSGDLRRVAQRLQILGANDAKEKRLDAAIAAFERALKIGRDLDDSRLIGNALTSVGFVLRQRNKFEEAARYYEEALAVNERSGDLQALAATQGNIAESFMQQRKFDEALVMYEKSRVSFEKS
ncbi:MAG TPA: tetratricopeptide repeat protein, partial [Terriglobales bacterium]|nr:tetratricopeptide repeat protein [Terriglobales bacterium]